MHIEVGNKFAAKEKLGSFCDVGEIAEVTDVTEDGLVDFTFNDCEEEGVFKRTGSMDISTFERYFEKVEEKVEEVKEFEVPYVSEEAINEILDHSKFDVYTVFDKCTVVSCQLPNGFVVTESSACVSSENYDEECGFDICYNKIFNKIWELETYRLQNDIYEWNGEAVEELNCGNCDDYDCSENPHYCS